MDSYVGFSSLQFQYDKNLVMRNVTLIKQDLLNNIYTRMGERVMMCDYGTRIPDIVGDPLDETSMAIVQQDLAQVFDNDPRVQLLDLQLIPLYDQNTLMCFAQVAYTYLSFVGDFSINIQFIDSTNGD
jgi:phage baseplate assembly protein W